MLNFLIKKIIFACLFLCVCLSESTLFARRGHGRSRSGGGRSRSFGRRSRPVGSRPRSSGVRRSRSGSSVRSRSSSRRGRRASRNLRSPVSFRGYRRGPRFSHRWNWWYGPRSTWFDFYWYPGLSCWYYPRGDFPWWWYPRWGYSFYLASSYPGIIIEADDRASSLWGAVYYRDPETGILVRYISPRALERDRIKWNISVRNDSLPRVVVIADSEDALDQELPEKPQEGSRVRYIPLKDPKTSKPMTREDEIALESLSDDDLSSLEAAKKEMRAKIQKDDSKSDIKDLLKKHEESEDK